MRARLRDLSPAFNFMAHTAQVLRGIVARVPEKLVTARRCTGSRDLVEPPSYSPRCLPPQQLIALGHVRPAAGLPHQARLDLAY
jgi:hypothetical protein